MADKEHERRFSGEAGRLRSAERIALLEVDRVTALSVEGLEEPRVLDVGAGTGVFTAAFTARGMAVTGIDSNSEMLEAARRFVPGGEFVQASAESVPYEDGSFDLVFLCHVLHEADEPVKALREARRVATMRVVVVEWPYVEEEQGPPLKHRLKKEVIVEMAHQAGLDNVEVLRLGHMDFYRMDIINGDVQGNAA